MHVNFNFVGLKINTRALGKKLVNPKMLLDYGLYMGKTYWGKSYNTVTGLRSQ